MNLIVLKICVAAGILMLCCLIYPPVLYRTNVNYIAGRVSPTLDQESRMHEFIWEFDDLRFSMGAETPFKGQSRFLRIDLLHLLYQLSVISIIAAIMIGVTFIRRPTESTVQHITLVLSKLIWLSIVVLICFGFWQIYERIYSPHTFVKDEFDKTWLGQNALLLWGLLLGGTLITQLIDSICIFNLFPHLPFRESLSPKITRLWRRCVWIVPILAVLCVYLPTGGLSPALYFVPEVLCLIGAALMILRIAVGLSPDSDGSNRFSTKTV